MNLYFLWFLPPLCDGQFLSSVFNIFSFSSTCFWDMPSVYLFLFMTSFLCCLSVFFYNLSNSVAVSTSLLLFPFLSYVSFLTVSPSVSYLFSCFCLPVSAISGSLIMLSVPLSLSLLSTLRLLQLLYLWIWFFCHFLSLLPSFYIFSTNFYDVALSLLFHRNWSPTYVSNLVWCILCLYLFCHAVLTFSAFL